MLIFQKNIMLMTVFAFIAFNSNILSQVVHQKYLDSIYSKFISIKNESVYQQDKNLAGKSMFDEKCLFSLAAQIKFNFNFFSAEQKKILTPFLQRPFSDTSFKSPSGFFRIHLDKNNFQSPKYNVNEFAKAIDSSLFFEVNFLGYPAPPKDKGEGGDDLYDVYIVNLGGAYGETTTENELSPGSGTYYSFIKIDNDFAGFYTTGINAAKVTAAHELHHAIQVGNYILRNSGLGFSDQFFYELSSTAMEDFVFNEVNDYHGYLKYFFNSPNKSFAKYDGYEISIWNIFLKEKYGFNLLKRQWEFLKNNRALIAINLSLLELSSSFGEELNEFSVWVNFTNYLAKENKFFPEAKFYPLLKFSNYIYIDGANIKSISLNVSPASVNYLKFINTYVGNFDTLIVAVNNSDVIKGVDSINSFQKFTYSLSQLGYENYSKITSLYFYKFETDYPNMWFMSEILNNELVGSNYQQRFAVDFVYPSPFFYNKHTFVSIPLGTNSSHIFDLNIYSSSMKLVFSKQFETNEKDIKWNGLSNNNEKLSSGIYLFVVNNGNKISKGKLVIINE